MDDNNNTVFRHAFVVGKYRGQGEKDKDTWSPVGVTFKLKEGREKLSIRPGISITGEVILSEPSEKDSPSTAQ